MWWIAGTLHRSKGKFRAYCKERCATIFMGPLGTNIPSMETCFGHPVQEGMKILVTAHDPIRGIIYFYMEGKHYSVTPDQVNGHLEEINELPK